MVKRKLNFLIYGAGVIGSIFACKLLGSGHNVHILARGNRLKEIKANGIILRNSLTGKKDSYKVEIKESLEPEDIYDYILVVMQKTQVDTVLPILAKNKTPNIVFIVNNPSGYDRWIKLLGKERMIIGFPSAGGERKAGEVNYFIGRGLSKLFQATTFGEIDGSKTQRLVNLVKAFKSAGFSPVIHHNMDAWQKTHVALITPIANVLYKYNGNNRSLSKSANDIKKMLMAVREGFNALRHMGISITPIKLNFIYLPTPILVPLFQIFMGSKIAEIAIAKHANVAKDEMLLLQKEFKKLIAQSEVQTPMFDELAKYNQAGQGDGSSVP